MFSMFDIVQSRGLMRFLIAAFSAGSPKRVEADRQEDVLAVHPVEAGDRVGRRLDVPVADVEVARRVRVHRQQVVAGPRRRRAGPSRSRPSSSQRACQRGSIDGGVVALDPARGRRGRSVAGRAVAGRHVWPHARDMNEPPAARRGVRSSACRQGVGGATGTRTPDLLNAIQTLSQLSYSPTPEREYSARGTGDRPPWVMAV